MEAAARSEAGSTRWRCSRVCSGQLINTSSSCKILKFQKKTHYKMYPQLPHRDVEDSASRWLRQHHLPSDFWGFYFGRNHRHLYPNRSLYHYPPSPPSSYPACHLLGNKQNPYCWWEKKSCTMGNEECSLFPIGLQHISIAAGFLSSKVYHPSSREVATEVVSHTKITTRPRINEWLGCWCSFLEMFYAIKLFVLARLAL